MQPHAVVPLWPDGWASFTQMGPKTNRFCLSTTRLKPLVCSPCHFQRKIRNSILWCVVVFRQNISFGVGYSRLKRRQVTDILLNMQLARGGNSNACNLRPVVITSLVVEQPGNSTVNCTRHVWPQLKFYI